MTLPFTLLSVKYFDLLSTTQIKLLRMQLPRNSSVSYFDLILHELMY
jgi:hypothetical protein